MLLLSSVKSHWTHIPILSLSLSLSLLLHFQRQSRRTQISLTYRVGFDFPKTTQIVNSLHSYRLSDFVCSSSQAWSRSTSLDISGLESHHSTIAQFPYESQTDPKILRLNDYFYWSLFTSVTSSHQSPSNKIGTALITTLKIVFYFRLSVRWSVGPSVRPLGQLVGRSPGKACTQNGGFKI